ncbi:MAG: hypothetical protein R3E12_11265 [Candidatus Eisenbacteria bacterium]
MTRSRSWVLLMALLVAPVARARPRFRGDRHETWTRPDRRISWSATSWWQTSIQPGVEVSVLGDYVIEVAGIIHADGTAATPVTFSRPDSVASWQGLVFQDALPGSSIQHCRIEGPQRAASGFSTPRSRSRLGHSWQHDG